MKKSRVIARARSASPKLPGTTLLSKFASRRQIGKKVSTTETKPS